MQVRLALFVLLAGGAILLFTVMLLQDIWKCFTMGCSAMIPMRIRSFWSSVPMPVHVHIALDGGMLFLLIVLFRLGYNGLTERINELRAHREFEAVMQRIRAGEDMDTILEDLKRRRGR